MASAVLPCAPCHRSRVLCFNGLAGKRKPQLPSQLSEPELVLVSPSMLSNPRLFGSVIWERIIVDEAHQVGAARSRGLDTRCLLHEHVSFKLASEHSFPTAYGACVGAGPA